MSDNILTLWFKNTDTNLVIPFTNNPVYEMQKDLVKQWTEARRKHIDGQYTIPTNWWGIPRVEAIIRVETQDTQISHKTLGDQTLMSRAEICIPYNNTVCMFKGYLRDFEIGQHLNFHVTHTLHNTDKDIGFSVSENNILLWTDSFPKELLEQL